MPVAMQKSESRLKLLPISGDDVPRYDDKNGKILVPEGDFLMYKGIHERTMILLNSWMDNREGAETELCKIADELDQWEKGCNISSVVGGMAGIGGGAAVIGGMVLMPPVAVAGLAVGAVAAASNLTTGILKMRNIKLECVAHGISMKDSNPFQKNLLTAKEMLEYDRKLTETLASSITTLEETKTSILTSHQIRVTKDIGVNLNKETVMSSSRIGTVSIAGGAVRLVLKESTTVSSAVAKGAVHAITAVGIAIDVLTVAFSVKGLVTGSRSEVAQKLRDAAEELKSSRESITRDFLVDYLL